MKKLVSIVLTTGLLMGTVAFSAMACGAGDRNQPNPPQKKVVAVQQRERQQPPVKPAPRPAPKHDQSVMPQDGRGDGRVLCRE